MTTRSPSSFVNLYVVTVSRELTFKVCTVLLSMNALVNNDVPPNMGDDLTGGINLHDERERLVLEKREDDDEEWPAGTPITVSSWLCMA